MKKKLTNAGMVRTYEDQLLQNYEFYKSAFELSKDPKIVLEDCKIVRFNSATMNFLESEEADEIYAHEFDEFLDDEHDHEFIDKKCSGNMFIELNIKTCKNNIIPATVNFDTISRNGQEISIATIHDITDRKEIEKELYASEERFRQIVERSSDIFYRQNINTTKFEYMSPKVKNILGSTPEEMYSLTVEEQAAQIHPDDLPGLINFRQDLIEADDNGIDSIEREFRIKHKLGGYKWIHGSYNLIRDANGKPEFIVGRLRDITEHKRMEKELQKNK